MRYLLALIMLMSTAARGEELHLLSLREFSMEAYRIPNNRDSYFQFADPMHAGSKEHWDKGISDIFLLDVIKYGDWGLYANNRVSGNTTNVQFRQVTWQWEGGFQLGRDTQVYWSHMSTHLLDAQRGDKYPLHNEYGIRYKFYERDADGR